MVEIDVPGHRCRCCRKKLIYRHSWVLEAEERPMLLTYICCHRGCRNQWVDIYIDASNGNRFYYNSRIGRYIKYG